MRTPFPPEAGRGVACILWRRESIDGNAARTYLGIYPARKRRAVMVAHSTIFRKGIP